MERNMKWRMKWRIALLKGWKGDLNYDWFNAWYLTYTIAYYSINTSFLLRALHTKQLFCMNSTHDKLMATTLFSGCSVEKGMAYVGQTHITSSAGATDPSFTNTNKGFTTFMIKSLLPSHFLSWNVQLEKAPCRIFSMMNLFTATLQQNMLKVLIFRAEPM